nr:Chain E, Meditope [synthetic construct]5ICZ_F Chain F, Meditope [synthetic construct]
GQFDLSTRRLKG